MRRSDRQCPASKARNVLATSARHGCGCVLATTRFAIHIQLPCRAPQALAFRGSTSLPSLPPLRSPMSIAPLDIFQFGEKEACLGWLGTHARADRHRDTVRVFSEDASYRFIWRGGAPQPPHTRRGRRSVCIKGMSMSAGLCVSPSRSFSLVLWVVQRLLFFHPYWFFGP